MPVYESDVCIIGAGITSAMLAEKLSELRLGVSINIVEAGRTIFDLENRYKYRERMMKYGENPWPGETIEGQAAAGGISRTMALGAQGRPLGGPPKCILCGCSPLKVNYRLIVVLCCAVRE